MEPERLVNIRDNLPRELHHVLDDLPAELYVERDYLTPVTQVDLIAKMIARGEPLTLIKAAWKSHVIQTIQAQSPLQPPLDINAMILQVNQLLYDETLKDLQLQALKVKQLQAMKSQLRDQTMSLRKALLNPDLSQEHRMMLQQQIDALEQELLSLNNDVQLGQLSLQQQMQKQQQLMQTMSNLSQILHDTAKAIIQNIG